MANNSVVTQQKLQEFYDTKIYDYLNGATHTGCDPVGTIKIVSGNEVPPYCLACDGTVYNIADYPDLAQFYERSQGASNFYGGDGVTTFAVPDLQGEFLRGSGTNSHTDQGSGANVGVHQDGTKHVNIDTFYNGSNSLEIGTAEPKSTKMLTTTNMDKSVSTDQYTYFTSSVTRRTDDARLQTYTSRPTNTSVLFCVVYKNNYIDLALDSFPIDISNPTDGQLLMYDATAGRWVNGGHKYSTDEHVVGTWIDGKPIYEKTINLTNPTWSGTDLNTIVASYTPIGASIDTVVDYKSKMFSSVRDNIYCFTQYTFGGGVMTIDTRQPTARIFVNSNKATVHSNAICLQVNSSNYADNYHFEVTVQYTKTTDTV